MVEFKAKCSFFFLSYNLGSVTTASPCHKEEKWLQMNIPSKYMTVEITDLLSTL